MERESFNKRKTSGSGNYTSQYKGTENSGGQSNKSLTKNAKYHKERMSSSSKPSATAEIPIGYHTAGHNAFQTGSYQSINELS